MVDETSMPEIKKKNSVDEFVENAKTATDGVVQTAKDYVEKTAKPVTDFVTEVRESETYAQIKDKAHEIAGDVKEAVQTYGPGVIPAAKVIGTRVADAAKGIASDISDLLPNRITEDAARLDLTDFNAKGCQLEYDTAKSLMSAGDKEEAIKHLDGARSMIADYRLEFIRGKQHNEKQLQYLNNLESSINRLTSQING